MSDHVPVSGKIPFAVGQTSAVRIPVPGTRGLCLELSARGRVPGCGSASTLFVRHPAGHLQSRLDFAYNRRSRTIDFQWSQNAALPSFVSGGQAQPIVPWLVPHSPRKCYRYAGRALLVGGVVADTVSIVQASTPLRSASGTVREWCARWLGPSSTPGCTPLASALDCVIAALSGLTTPAELALQVYDWAESTLFTPLDEVRPVT